MYNISIDSKMIKLLNRDSKKITLLLKRKIIWSIINMMVISHLLWNRKNQLKLIKFIKMLYTLRDSKKITLLLTRKVMIMNMIIKMLNSNLDSKKWEERKKKKISIMLLLKPKIIPNQKQLPKLKLGLNQKLSNHFHQKILRLIHPVTLIIYSH